MKTKLSILFWIIQNGVNPKVLEFYEAERRKEFGE